MGFLNDLVPNVDWTDSATVPSDPNIISDGAHHAYVFDAKVIDLTARGKGKSLVISYKMAEDDKDRGRIKDEWRSLPVVNPDGQFASDKDRNSATWLKRRLLDLGVPESKLNELDPSDLVGTEVIVTFKTNGQWQNVVNVKLATDGNEVTGATANASSLNDLL